ncbi:MAG: DUF1697 domain-containing protein [Treponema sp.]|nr:DUF1697 domain-containing protein [Treponema sp.]MDY6396850.1 DUF1697 domain-containing protein [Treponema sp.]
MKRYIALLRGINISGKNKISMSELNLTEKNTIRPAGGKRLQAQGLQK